MKHIAALWRLAIVAVVAVVLLVLVSNVITQPIASKLGSYVAEFTDVSGLRTGADVRVRGVRVGKVLSIELRRQSERSIGEVRFTLDSRYSIGADTRLAVKYQALTGLRYVDVVDAYEDVPAPSPTTRIPTSMTQPSFDITRLFNGLQPVLATLSPEDLNAFTSNVETFLAGDGTGLGPVLQSIHKLTELAADRQQVIATLLQNLKAVADTMHGRAKDVTQVLTWIHERLIDSVLRVLDEFYKSHLYGPDFTSAVVRLLDAAGLKRDIDIDDAFDRAFTVLDDNISAFKFIPVIWGNIPPPSQEGHPLECSRGRAELPLPVDMLLNGQKVVLCKS